MVELAKDKTFEFICSALSVCILSCNQVRFGGTVKVPKEGSLLNAQGSGMDETCGCSLVEDVLPGTAFVFLTNCGFFFFFPSLGLPFHCLYDLCLPYSR